MKKLFDYVCISLIILLPYVGNSKDYPFEVNKTGSGKESIIFIPGFACSGDVWNETKLLFEKNYFCYTLTMAGFAGVAPQAGSTFSSWEAAIAEFIRDNKIAKPIIVGHSMGGALALAIAADYPDLVSRIVVVDALPCLSALMDSGFTTKENNDCTPMVNAMTSLTNEQFYQRQKQTIPQLLADGARHETVVEWSMKSDRATLAGIYCDFTNTDLRDKISTIKCPSLILLESYFVNFKPAINQQYENLRTANLQFATKGLHFVMFDDKEWYNQQLTNFIIIKGIPR